MNERSMILDPLEVDWPKLSWLAAVRRGSNSVRVLHGSAVESGPDRCVEAVWTGHFAEGDFDRTDIVIGTGLRVRNDKLVFVSSGDTLNRLYYHEGRDTILVSNSFTALITTGGMGLLSDFDYAEAMASIMQGLDSYQKSVPSTAGPVHIVYYRNLEVRNHAITITDKPPPGGDFSTFAGYRDFLFESARVLKSNAAAAARRHAVTPLASISSGYDSSASALLARTAGAREAATIEQGRRTADNLFSLRDSGESVARQLGLSCTTYSRYRRNYPFEDAGWASMGHIGDLSLALFDHPRPVCLLFSGFMGDVLWAKDTVQTEPLRRIDTSGARFSEMRLELGVLLCSPVFWGCRREGEILRLSHRPEMHPWNLGVAYDRPIPRRLLEEAGIDRNSFGTRKRAAGFSRRYGRPLSVDLRPDFACFLEQRGRRPSGRLAETTALGLAGFDWVVLRRLRPAIPLACRDWVNLPSATEFFLWGNERRRRRFLQGAKNMGPDTGSPPLRAAHGSNP